MFVQYKVKYKGKTIRIGKSGGRLTLNLSNIKIDDINEIKGLETLRNLQTLNLAENQISEIKGLEKLVNLQELYLQGNNITEIKGLEKLSNLQTISFRQNKITEIKGLEKLSNLQKLYLQRNKISEIKGLKNLSNLQILYLGGNQITEIKDLENQRNLKGLYLDGNQITEIKSLENLISLQKLSLGGNQITEIKSLEKLVHLQSLSLGGNHIKEIRGLEKLTNLQTLYLWGNQIMKIKGLENIRSLQKLYLWGNQITEISGLENLTNLQRLSFERNQITELKGINNLTNLRWIDLENNPIEKLVIKEFGKHYKRTPRVLLNYGRNLKDKSTSASKGPIPTKTTSVSQKHEGIKVSAQYKGKTVRVSKSGGRFTLTLSFKGITDISDIIGLEALNQLQTLHLQGNKITEIKGLENLTNLERLSLDQNYIKEIKGLENLKKLQTLNLAENQITELKGIENLSNLRWINFKNNPIEKWIIKEFGINYKRKPRLLLTYLQKISKSPLKKVRDNYYKNLNDKSVTPLKDPLTAKNALSSQKKVLEITQPNKMTTVKGNLREFEQIYPLPFAAYKGNEPYVFVSYSHKDNEFIYPDIEMLHIDGFQIWYDEGIPLSKSWNSEVAKALKNCACFVVFLSDNSVQSQHVENEINCAFFIF